MCSLGAVRKNLGTKRTAEFGASGWALGEHCLSGQLSNNLPLATVSQLRRVSCGGSGKTEAPRSQNYAAVSRDSEVINGK